MQNSKQHYPNRQKHRLIIPQTYFHQEAEAGLQHNVTTLPKIPRGI